MHGVARRKRWVWISSILGVAGATALAVAAVLRWHVFHHLDPGSNQAWMWVERLSWIAGVGSLLIVLMSLLSYRSNKRGEPLLALAKIRSGMYGAVGSAAPATSTIEVPLGRLGTPIRGRDEVVKILTTLLARRGVGPRVHVLHGLGGCGKTTIALMLARLAIRRGVVVWWISASTTTDLHTGMRHVVSRLGGDDEEIDRAWSGVDSATDLLWRLLNQYHGRWLLIVDNADEPESLAGAGTAFADGTGWLRPPNTSTGSVVVTSREGDPAVWGSWCQLHPIPLLSANDGAQILLDHTGKGAGTFREAEELSSCLGGLPLALRLVGSYIAETMAVPWPASTTTFNGYQTALETGRLGELLDVRPATSNLTSEQSRAVLGRTWEFSLDLLDRRGASQARPLLRLLSYFAEAPIPYQLVLHPDALATFELFACIDALRLWHLLRALAHLGLVDLSAASSGQADGAAEAGTPPTLRIHPLVRQVSRHQGDVADQKALNLAIVATLLHRAAESEGAQSTEDPRRWATWQTLAPHALHVVDAVKGLPGLTIETAGHVAYAAQLTNQYLRARGLYGQAESGHRATLDSCGPALGDGHISTMAARHSLAAIMHTRGRLDAAEAEYRAVLDDRRRVLGDEHPHTLATRHQLAFLLYDRGQLNAAEAEWREVLATNEAARGEDDLLTMNSRCMLARVWLGRGQLDTAEVAYQAVLAAQRRVFGDDHPRTLATRHDLARVLHDRGQLDAAEREYQAVLTAQQRLLGDDHRDVLLTRSQLAKVQHDRGRLAAAESAYRAVLTVQKRVLGEEHPMTLTTHDRLAGVLQDRGDRPAAESAYEAVLSSRRRVLGADHPDTASTQHRLLLLRQGKSSRVQPL